MKSPHLLLPLALAAFAFTSLALGADNMVSIGITPATGVVTVVPRWTIGTSLAGFHHMPQDLSLGGGANQFYSIKSTGIPPGGDILAFTRYTASSGAASSHDDIGSKLTPNSYSALTSADPDIGYGSVNFYFIHHKATGDYFSIIVPGSATSSSVDDLKPMSGPGGPATLGDSGYFGLTFAAANLGYGLNQFYYFRTDPVTDFTIFGVLSPALLGTSMDKFDLGVAGHNALTFTGTDVGYGTDKMYYLRLDELTGYSILGTLAPLTGKASDIANLGSVYSTLDFVVGDVGFGTSRFYVTGTVNPTWQSISFAAIPNRALNNGAFTVSPSASSGLPVALSVVSGSATVSAPVGGVFTVTPVAPGMITLQATQVGQIAPTAFEYNMLRQSFLVTGINVSSVDFNTDGKADTIWQNKITGERGIFFMNGATPASWGLIGYYSTDNDIVGSGDFNSDGRPDTVWQNKVTGERGIFFMDGAMTTSWALIGYYNTNYNIVGVGDFNADGKSDTVWENKVTGERGIFMMNGATILSWSPLGTYSPNYQIVGVADFNGDGKPDTVWQNKVTGERGIFFMNGATFTSWALIGYYSTDYDIVGAADFNADGKADTIWQNKVTGERGIFLMNGATILSWSPIGSYSIDYDIVN